MNKGKVKTAKIQVIETEVATVRAVSPALSDPSSITTPEMLDRIDVVLRANTSSYWVFVVLAVILFLSGITAILVAVFSGKMEWSVPSVVTTLLLKFPFDKIMEIRSKNIVLATVPILITQLPSEEAAKALQRLIDSLYPHEKPNR